jgi:hypothetical protein
VGDVCVSGLAKNNKSVDDAKLQHVKDDTHVPPVLVLQRYVVMWLAESTNPIPRL